MKLPNYNQIKALLIQVVVSRAFISGHDKREIGHGLQLGDGSTKCADKQPKTMHTRTHTQH